MTTKPDDLEAVRQVADTLQPFSDSERERILRWARERLGMSGFPAQPTHQLPGSQVTGTATAGGPSISEVGQDIASFIAKKAPKSDVHFATTVAYYYQFVAPVSERKDSITKEDLLDACRKAPRNRPKRPAQVLVNAYHEGFLDRGERGQYRLNSVGENLVAMVLPAGGEAPAREKSKRTTTTKKPAEQRRRRTAKVR